MFFLEIYQSILANIGSQNWRQDHTVLHACKTVDNLVNRQTIQKI
jgi:hypothetical protein